MMWLYQLSETHWSSNKYRLDIWESERWNWGVQKVMGRGLDSPPQPGDTVVFYYAKAGCKEPGFYGWAVILLWIDEEGDRQFYFRPVAPSDQLKMFPWGDDAAHAIADEVRGKPPRGTLWPIEEELAAKIGAAINGWTNRRDVMTAKK